jgi:hypothetical protein
MAQTGFDERYGGTLHLIGEKGGAVTISFEPSSLAYQHAMGTSPASGKRLPRRDVVRFDAAKLLIEIWPIIIYPPRERFLKPRFDQIQSIVFEGYPVRLPKTSEEVADCLEVLPEAFYRRAEFGMGLPVKYKPIIGEIELTTEVTRLVISKTRSAKLEGSTLILAHDQFVEAAEFMQRVVDRHQRRSLQERRAYAHNHLITPLDPATYPEWVPPYTEDTIFESLNVVRQSKLKLSVKDKTSLVEEVSKRVSDLKRAAPEKLFRLHRNIELVNLDTIIERYKALLASPIKAEKRWQKLFDLNPFILSMVFGYPIVSVLREATVAGPKLDGRGAKIADFLMKNPTTSNAALVELKTPQQELLAASPYRGKSDAHPVYPPHPGLSGAVSQILDQRYRLQKDIATHLSNNEGLVLKTYHVDCVVVAGRLPTDSVQTQALDIYRYGLKDVRIVTFDELLVKLESLRELLASDSEPAGRPEESEDVSVDSEEDFEAEDAEE